MSKTKEELIMELPRECFKHASGVEQIDEEMQNYKTGNVEVESVNHEGAITLGIKDADFPWKTLVSAENLWASNMMKAVIIQGMKITPPWILLLKRDKVIDSFLMVGKKIMTPHFLKEEHMTTFSKEFQWCLFTFMVEIGIDENKADKVAEILVHLFEFDNAYRFRMQDIFHATTKKKLQRPSKEMRRLIGLVMERNTETVGIKFKLAYKVVSLMLLVPKYRRAFKTVVEGVDLKNLQFDKGDLYWTAVRTDYDFRGLSKYARMKQSKFAGWKYPEGLS
jgi:hypothetical protein